MHRVGQIEPGSALRHYGDALIVGGQRNFDDLSTSASMKQIDAGVRCRFSTNEILQLNIAVGGKWIVQCDQFDRQTDPEIITFGGADTD